jgi:LPS-assembly protein
MSALCFAADNPQLTLGDKVSIYSDKAYRKNQGKHFEAVGNVVIISQQDTIYGELASLDQDTQMVKIEGNVRIITKDMTLYGSHLDYNLATGVAHIKNARILTPSFNLVATNITRLDQTNYIAKEGEFTTCKDCLESWSVFGKTIRVTMGSHVRISHGLAKIKGANVLYIPYLVLPIGTKRKTGLLFPEISSRVGEGLAFEQPVFLALDDDKDATLSPTFWAQRGYGGDIQYRHRFSEMSWLEFNSRLLNDKIYAPGKTGQSQSGEEFFRYITDIETHQQWSPNFNTHMRYTGTRDLDIVRDHPLYTDPKITSSEFGFRGHADWRRELFDLSLETNYLRNQLYEDPLEFDRSYVQQIPRVGFSTVPYTLVQTTTPMLEKITFGFDGAFDRFRQVDQDDTLLLRNVDRFSTKPYVQWNLFTAGPVSMRTLYQLDQQAYFFADHREPSAGKNANILQSEISFTMDKIFGLAYEEKVPVKYIPPKDLERLRANKEQGLTPLRQVEKESRLIGEVPAYQSALASENIIQVRNSYRHSQQYKFIHHFISTENEYGNERFLNQIKASRQGQFDYEDSIRSREYLSGSAVMRTTIPLWNTLEFQWNNSLIKKTPRRFNYFDDNKYLRDNFAYGVIGYFNISQGYLLDTIGDSAGNQRLTRLLMQAGYSASRWSLAASESYFHYVNQHILSISGTRSFDYLNLFSSYNTSSFQESKISTLSAGGQVRPTDILGLAMVKELDLEADQNIRTIYSLDIMPHNNCWILSFNYRESLDDSRFNFNILFNFGDEEFQNLRNNYFALKRL